jgi:predicted AAA+ superfamily ATPase
LVVESLIAAAPMATEAHFFRTSAGAELDLLLQLPGHPKPWAIEIKRGVVPKIGRGFHLASETVVPERRFVVYSGTERFPLGDGIEAISLSALCEELDSASS